MSPHQVDLNEVEFISETSLTIRGTRRRTTIPKAIVDRFELKNGDKIRWVVFNDGNIMVAKVKKKA
jgi:bifunctional DNA-binding transcriptional regulator/antitoxin component of YhaV-PrlF toxin-antitoxin module